MSAPKETTSTVIGVMLAVIGNSLQGLGFVLQKYSHNRLKIWNKKNPTKQKGYLTSKVWILGLITVICGSIVNAVALNFGPQSLILPLSSTTLLMNTILAIAFLKEPYNKFDMIGVIVVIVGTVLTIGIINLKYNTNIYMFL